MLIMRAKKVKNNQHSSAHSPILVCLSRQLLRKNGYNVEKRRRRGEKGNNGYLGIMAEAIGKGLIIQVIQKFVYTL